ncbi:MAG: hypothetical protein KAT56_01745, partial [Sedimentisphaerales bacterium]|nr:hypothetical protein [Sedimentisphaerales bacterium]
MRSLSCLIGVMIFISSVAHEAVSAPPRVAFVESDNKIDVMVGGKLFTSYVYAPDPTNPPIAKGIRLTKPVLYPIYSP